MVWVEFEEGDTDKPLWSDGPLTKWTGKSDLPRHAREVYDDSDNYMRGTAEIPPAQINGKYGKSQGVYTPGGCKIELDDTEGSERVVIEHPTGSRYEILADGSCQDISGNRREVYDGSHVTRVTGRRELSIDGVATETYNTRDVIQNGEYTQIHLKNAVYKFKNKVETLGNDTRIIEGSDEVQIYGNKTTSVGSSMNTSVLGEYNLSFLEASTWSCAGGLTISPLLGVVTVRRPVPVQVPDFMTKATNLLIWLATHTHIAPSGPTAPPTIPPSPSIIATTLMAE